MLDRVCSVNDRCDAIIFDEVSMTSRSALRAIVLATALLAIPVALPTVLAVAPAAAQVSQSPADEAPEARRKREFREAVDALQTAAKPGPVDIPLIDQGVIKVPEGYVFVPSLETAKLMRAMGNRTGSNLAGMLFAAKDGLNWFALITYNKAGYVKDDDAKDWKADELLSQLREGTDSGNADRIQRGFTPVEVVGWVAPPAYDASTHRLVWSALLRDKGAADSNDASINYNTYALGREGFFQLNLITNEKQIEQDKVHARVLLAALGYNDGKRYEDFNASTDKVAEFGLAALIAGAAAKKLGAFALIAAFLVKAWKLVAIGVIGFGSLFAKMFRRRRGG
jgi:uncharacterized membrane-anchored protein